MLRDHVCSVRFTLAAIYFCSSVAAIAQDDVADEDANEYRLEEVVVTAQKRIENPRDVPMALSVMSADDIRELGIQDFNDMMRLIPSVSFYDKSSSIYVRGIGTPEGNPLGEQAIAYILDGLYIPKYSYLKSSFMDLERIEVLKGPQGTLFGRNATAGVINLINAKPTDEWQARVSLTGGNRDIKDTEVMVSGPITDEFSMRLAGRKRVEGGTTFSTTDQAYLDDRDQRQARLSMKYDFSETTIIDLSVTKFDYSLGGGTEFHVYPEDLRPFVQSQDPNLETVLDRRTSLPTHDDDPDQRSDGGEGYIIPLTISWDMFNHSFVSVTGYAELFEDLGIDLDKTAIDISSSSVIQDETQLSQELRVLSPKFDMPFLPGSFDYVFGAYYYEQQNDASIEVPLYGDFATFLGGLPGAGTVPDPLGILNLGARPDILDVLGGNFDLETKSTALFGQLTWAVTDSLSLMFGARQSKDIKKVFLDVYTTGPVPFWDKATEAPFQVDKTNVFRNFSPKYSLTWDATDEMTAYFTLAKGFRAGSFNAGASERRNVEFQPETSSTIEIGLKTELLDGRIRANIGMFETDYKDYQVSTFAGLGVVILNVPETQSRGAEADIVAVLVPGLILNASAAYLDARFIDNKDNSCPTTPYSEGDLTRYLDGSFTRPSRGCDVSGETLHRSPRWTGSLGLNYVFASFELGVPLELFTGFSATYKGLEYQDSDLDPLDIQDRHTLYNARIGVQTRDGSWRFEVHGKNLTDEIVKTFSQDVPFSAGAHDSATNSGKYYFATLHYNFGM